MILEELSLVNYGIYKGEHKVDLRPLPGKPIILFGALNGSGKTTFLDALNLVLYGKSTKGSSKGRLGYDDYLESMINRDTPKQHGAGLTLKFKIRQNSKDEEIKIVRTWFKAGNAIKENFEVIRDGQLDRLYTERWSDFIEEIMPSEISELFFFDGEKIEGLADPTKSSEILRAGIYSLLGINEVDSLIRSLSQIEKRKLIELSKETNQIDIAPEEAKLNDLAESKQKILTQLAQLTNEFDEVEGDTKSVEDKLKISGADLLRDRDSLEERLSFLNNQLEQINDDLVNIAGSNLPLLLVKQLLEEIKTNADSENGITKKSLNIISGEYEQFIAKSDARLTGDVTRLVANLIAERKRELEAKIDHFMVDVEPESIPSASDFELLRGKVASEIKRSDSIQEEILLINRKLSAVPDEAKVSGLVEKLNGLMKLQAKLSAKKDILENDLVEIEKQIEDVSRSLSQKMVQIANTKTNNVVLDRVINHSRKSRDTLNNYKKALLEKHINGLGNQITSCFADLHRKNNMNLKFRINLEDFTLEIIKNETELNPNSLSAGERQLLSVAILWALAKSAKRILPTVIDTPLGRLDGPHRNKLITNYFPFASNQVLIFSTDEEITSNYYHKLKSHVSKEYLINYNQETESSVITTGYFGV